MSFSLISSLGNYKSTKAPFAPLLSCIQGNTATPRSAISANNFPALGTTYTIEFYLRILQTNAQNTQNVIALGTAQNSQGIQVYLAQTATNNLFYLGFHNGSINTGIEVPNTYANKFFHVAIVKSTTNVKYYIDGTQIYNATIPNDNCTGNVLNLFKTWNDSARPITGTYVASLRVTGKAVYTGPFKPHGRLTVLQTGSGNIATIGVNDCKLLMNFTSNPNVMRDDSVYATGLTNTGIIYEVTPP